MKSYDSKLYRIDPDSVVFYLNRQNTSNGLELALLRSIFDSGVEINSECIYEIEGDFHKHIYIQFGSLYITFGTKIQRDLLGGE